jgi:hypothetical protein
MASRADTNSLAQDPKSEKSNKSTKSNHSKKSNVKNNQPVVIESEDISFSQLELMANKKKINKKTEVSLSEPVSNHDNVGPKAKSEPKPRTKSSSSIGSVSSDTKTDERRKRNVRQVQRENNNEFIRKEKVEYLYKLDKLAQKGRSRAVNMDMNNSLDEIRNEYERISNDMKTERSVSFFKRMLLLGVQGVEMLNTKFDPLGVDLDGWSEAMGYSMENQEYDEVMAELYEKYKGSGQMSPEVKLIFMIISSATMFTISKKISKLDSSNAFKNIIGSFVGNQPPPPQTQFQAPHFQQPSQPVFHQGYNAVPSAEEMRKKNEPTETTEDPRPSRIRGPNMNSDGININQILRTMNERKLEKDREMEKIMETETSDDVFKSIPLNTQKKAEVDPKKRMALQRYHRSQGEFSINLECKETSFFIVRFFAPDSFVYQSENSFGDKCVGNNLCIHIN